MSLRVVKGFVPSPLVPVYACFTLGSGGATMELTQMEHLYNSLSCSAWQLSPLLTLKPRQGGEVTSVHIHAHHKYFHTHMGDIQSLTCPKLRFLTSQVSRAALRRVCLPSGLFLFDVHEYCGEYSCRCRSFVSLPSSTPGAQ